MFLKLSLDLTFSKSDNIIWENSQVEGYMYIIYTIYTHIYNIHIYAMYIYSKYILDHLDDYCLTEMPKA